MKYIKENFIIFLIIVLFASILTAVLFIYYNSDYKADNKNIRIASLSPSITEYIYDIKMDKYLIADTTYCNYPEQAKYKEKIGSFSDINYEMVAKLNINTAIIHSHMAEQKLRLEKMGIKVIVINNNTIDDILSAYDILGDAFNIKNITDERKNEIISKINSIKNNIKKHNKKTAVVSIFRNYGSKVSSITAAGGNNIYNDILNILNLKNPFENLPAYTEVSLESIIATNPDVIFDLYHGRDTTYAYNDWKNIPLNAVNDNKIIILYDTYLSLPGPRIDKIIEKFASEYNKVSND